MSIEVIGLLLFIALNPPLWYLNYRMTLKKEAQELEESKKKSREYLLRVCRQLNLDPNWTRLVRFFNRGPRPGPKP